MEEFGPLALPRYFPPWAAFFWSCNLPLLASVAGVAGIAFASVVTVPAVV